MVEIYSRSLVRAMQYSNTALETTTLVMYDPNTFFYVVPLFLMALRLLHLSKSVYDVYDMLCISMKFAEP